MRSFIHYLKDYFRKISLKNFLFTLVFTTLLVSLNYTLGIENRIRALSPWPLSFFVFFGFYLIVFGIAYYLQSLGAATPRTGLRFAAIPDKKLFGLLLLLAPLFFSLKMVHWDLSFIAGPGITNSGNTNSGVPGPSASAPWNHYWLTLLQLPAKLAVMLFLLYACWRVETGYLRTKDYHSQLTVPGGAVGNDSFYGLTARNFSALPYFQILLLLAPLVAIASTQHDFLLTYPKVKSISFLDGYAHPAWPWRLLYEISYGLDFVSIELFFRGFLVLGFVRFAGIHAILPMAVFYCAIHFGKPLGECVSSFFGGLALGVIAWRTRTILGGLIVHLGLAWMMEIGGWLGNSL